MRKMTEQEKRSRQKFEDDKTAKYSNLSLAAYLALMIDRPTSFNFLERRAILTEAAKRIISQ